MSQGPGSPADIMLAQFTDSINPHTLLNAWRRRPRSMRNRFKLPTPQTYYGHAGYRPSSPTLSSAGAPNIQLKPPGGDFNPILSGRGPGTLNPPMRFGAPPPDPVLNHTPGRFRNLWRLGGELMGPPPGSGGGGGNADLGFNPGSPNYYQHPFPTSPGVSPFDPGPFPTPFAGGPLVPYALRGRYPGGRGFGGPFLGGGLGGGGWGRGGGVFGPPPYGPDGQIGKPSFYDRSHTPYGPRNIERSVPGRGERMQGPWRADNRPPLGWRAEAWDRGHAPQFGTGRTGKDRFDRWGLLSGMLRGAGKNAAEGRNSRTNLLRGAIANFLKERYEW